LYALAEFKKSVGGAERYCLDNIVAFFFGLGVDVVSEIFKKLCEKSAAAYSDNSIRPNDKATRADLVMMACGGREAIEEKIRLRREKRSPFKDVSYKSEYCGAFSLAAKQGLIEIRDGRAEPALPAFGEEGITRGMCAEKVLKLV